ncbi:hypothetical protein PoB_003447900 [Plakobranchus ocellatus]|uniref:Uncharacterized protein n=1 Tax=Plakobranchus ocellatus TaxID=259542 RepID=A0AAV4ANR4_9GAST|nr:hypothetical protein PoB_003447900 [Plakobranchus ocellatus]
MLRYGMKLKLAGVYDGQRSRSNLMYWQLVQIASYSKVIPGFKALVKWKRSFQAEAHDSKVSADFRASSLATDPPTSHIVRDQNGIAMA